MSTEHMHLAIIPDGNRRWATQRALQPWKGHEEALKMSRTLLDWCYEHPSIDVLTFWGFSTENWNRPQIEIDQLMRMYEDFLAKERATFQEKQTRFVHSGRTDRIPASLKTLIETLTHETATHTRFTLQFALDYGGKDETIRAIHKVTEPATVTADSFREYLDHPELPDIDLIIRTSGEQRTSNFFFWQAAYAEWVFLPKLYPELTTADLEAAIEHFQGRERRFGK